MKKQIRTVLLCSAGMLLLILDSRTVLQGGVKALELCFYTVIPALFPFFVIAGVLNSSLLGLKIPGLRQIGKLCGLPKGSESILLLGFLGGYPVGAKCVNDCCKQGVLDKDTARRMLGFCSNCGPSFLFGICTSLFTNPGAAWCIWFIQILSAIITGILLPGKKSFSVKISKGDPRSVHESLESSILIMGEVCGWVIAFRVVIELCRRWFLWLVPSTFQALFVGLLELTNGCSMLHSVPSEPLRFVLCSSLLSFGGICVLMQSVSATNTCGLGMYFPGKLMQFMISFLLSSLASAVIYREMIPAFLPLSACFLAVLAGLLRFYQKKM